MLWPLAALTKEVWLQNVVGPSKKIKRSSKRKHYAGLHLMPHKWPEIMAP